MNAITEPRRSYRHLSIEEREVIFTGLAEDKNYAQIAAELGRHRSTISREVRRNISLFNRYRYLPREAQRRYTTRLVKSHIRMPLKNAKIRAYVEQHLKLGWSPQIIAGRLPIDAPSLSTNYESIYQFIYRHRPAWVQYLPQAHKKRRKRSSKRSNRGRLTHRTWIDERTEPANTRTEEGHWEADTVFSAQFAAGGL